MPICTVEMLTLFKGFIVILPITILKVNSLLFSCLWHSQSTVKLNFLLTSFWGQTCIVTTVDNHVQNLSFMLRISLVAQLVKNLPARQVTWVQSLVVKIPWRRERLPTPAFLPGEFHELYSPWGHMTEQLSLSFPLQVIRTRVYERMGHMESVWKDMDVLNKNFYYLHFCSVVFYKFKSVIFCHSNTCPVGCDEPYLNHFAEALSQ